MMGVPWETHPPRSGYLIPGGQTATELVKIPPRCFISKIVVVQTVGSLDGFTVELFNHKDALEGTPSSLSSSDPASDVRIPLECYRVSPPLVAAAGEDTMRYFSDEATGGHGLLFFCQDPYRPDRQGQSLPNLYLRISPNGIGAKAFAYCIGGESQISGA